jgi:hypothetical protein
MPDSVMKTAEMRGQLSTTTTFLNGGYDGGDRRTRVSADGVLCRRLLMVRCADRT